MLSPNYSNLWAITAVTSSYKANTMELGQLCIYVYTFIYIIMYFQGCPVKPQKVHFSKNVPKLLEIFRYILHYLLCAVLYCQTILGWSQDGHSSVAQHLMSQHSGTLVITQMIPGWSQDWHTAMRLSEYPRNPEILKHSRDHHGIDNRRIDTFIHSKSTPVSKYTGNPGILRQSWDDLGIDT